MLDALLVPSTRVHVPPPSTGSLYRRHVRPRPSVDGPARALVRAAVLLVAVCVAGTVGYAMLAGPEYSWFDAVYMTTITLTTVGYGETIDLSDNVPGRVFTVGLLLSGVGSFVYFFSNLTAFFVEGHLDRIFRERRMTRAIDRLSDHYIVCGGGDTGEHVVRELLTTRRSFVLVERDEERVLALQDELGVEFAAVTGDATDDDVLRAAGIERAAGLVTCISNDKDNMLVTFSARALRGDLRVVSRCTDVSLEAKIRKAGANSVVSPNTIGGMRLVSELVRPTVVSFLDAMLHADDEMLRVEEVLIEQGSPLDGVSLSELPNLGLGRILVVALHMGTRNERDAGWVYNPCGTTMLAAGQQIITIANVDQRARLEALASARR